MRQCWNIFKFAAIVIFLLHCSCVCNGFLSCRRLAIQTPSFSRNKLKLSMISSSPSSSAAGGDKMIMLYKCKLCGHRNINKVSKVAYYEGIVLSICRGCNNRHYIADNLNKLDMSEYSTRIENFLEAKGETVRRLSLGLSDLINQTVGEDTKFSVDSQ